MSTAIDHNTTAPQRDSRAERVPDPSLGENHSHQHTGATTTHAVSDTPGRSVGDITENKSTYPRTRHTRSEDLSETSSGETSHALSSRRPIDDAHRIVAPGPDLPRLCNAVLAAVRDATGSDRCAICPLVPMTPIDSLDGPDTRMRLLFSVDIPLSSIPRLVLNHTRCLSDPRRLRTPPPRTPLGPPPEVSRTQVLIAQAAALAA